MAASVAANRSGDGHQQANLQGRAVGLGNLGSAHEQVFLRVRSTCSAPVATFGSGLSIGRDTCFVNIVRRHRPPPCLTSGSPQGSISHHGNAPASSGPAERSQRETPGQGHNRTRRPFRRLVGQPERIDDWRLRDASADAKSAVGRRKPVLAPGEKRY